MDSWPEAVDVLSSVSSPRNPTAPPTTSENTVGPRGSQIPIRAFPYLLKCICNAVSAPGFFTVICRHTRRGKKFELPMRALPAGLEQGAPLPSRFSSHSANKCPFHGLLSATFFTFLCFWLVILLFKTALRHSAECCLALPSARRLQCAHRRK